MADAYVTVGTDKLQTYRNAIGGFDVDAEAVRLVDSDGVPITTLPISGTVATGGLTDTQLRATAVPVSGTFWQATQPVSLATVPSHAVTNAGTFAVQVTSAPTTAVTGTFWQATQPVSGTVAVTGTFWQATQPVSIAATVATSLAAQPGAVNNANSQVTASTTAATLAVARATRRRLLAKNIDTSITVYVGAATVTAANGMQLLAGESVELRSQILYQVIAASGSPIVAIVDEYD